MNEVTYSESLRVAWLLLWRGALIGFGLGALAGFIVGLSAGLSGYGDKLNVQLISGLLGGLIGLFYAYPLVVRMALRKQFDGFRLQIVRGNIRTPQ
jgi:hypothetical protein